MKDPLTPEWRKKVDRIAREIPIDFDRGDRLTPTERDIIRSSLRPHTPLNLHGRQR